LRTAIQIPCFKLAPSGRAIQKEVQWSSRMDPLPD